MKELISQVQYLYQPHFTGIAKTATTSEVSSVPLIRNTTHHCDTSPDDALRAVMHCETALPGYQSLSLCYNSVCVNECRKVSMNMRLDRELEAVI